MNRGLFFIPTLCMAFSSQIGASPGGRPVRSASVLAAASGSLDDFTSMENRAHCELGYNGLELAAGVADRRDISLDEPMADDSFSLQLVHKASRSALLYGPLELSGIAFRLGDPFAKRQTGASERTSLGARIDGDASVLAPAQACALLGLPIASGAFALAAVRESAFHAAFRAEKGRDSFFEAEAFGAGTTDEAEKAEGWFSEKAPLPGRAASIFAFGSRASLPSGALALDLAASEAEIGEAGLYAEAALDVRLGRWLLSGAAGGASEDFRDARGERTGAARRASVRLLHEADDIRTVRTALAFDGRGKPERAEAVLGTSEGASRKSAAPVLHFEVLSIAVGASLDLAAGEEPPFACELSGATKVGRLRAEVTVSAAAPAAAPAAAAAPATPSPTAVGFGGTIPAAVSARLSLALPVGPFRFRLAPRLEAGPDRLTGVGILGSIGIVTSHAAFAVQAESRSSDGSWRIGLRWRLLAKGEAGTAFVEDFLEPPGIADGVSALMIVEGDQ